jgi:hypothetical protein
MQQPVLTANTNISEHLQFRFGVCLLNNYKIEQAFLSFPILNTCLVFERLSSADLGDERIASHDVVRAAPATANDNISMLAPRLHHSTTSILCNLYAHTLCRAEWRQTVIARRRRFKSTTSDWRKMLELSQGHRVNLPLLEQRWLQTRRSGLSQS